MKSLKSRIEAVEDQRGTEQRAAPELNYEARSIDLDMSVFGDPPTKEEIEQWEQEQHAQMIVEGWELQSDGTYEPISEGAKEMLRKMWGSQLHRREKR